MHLHVDELTSTTELDAIADELRRALADVRAAVDDWRLMRERLVDTLKTLHERKLQKYDEFIGWFHFKPFDGEPEQETTACYECPVCILQLNPDDGVMCCPPTARGLFQTAVTEPGAALYLASDPLPYPRFLSRAPPA